jgi:hypothetical protein
MSRNTIGIVLPGIMQEKKGCFKLSFCSRMARVTLSLNARQRGEILIDGYEVTITKPAICNSLRPNSDHPSRINISNEILEVIDSLEVEIDPVGNAIGEILLTGNGQVRKK